MAFTCCQLVIGWTQKQVKIENLKCAFYAQLKHFKVKLYSLTMAVFRFQH